MLDLVKIELGDVVDVLQVRMARIIGRHAEDLVVAAGLIGHFEHRDGAAFDDTPGERWERQDHERVQRVAVEAQGVVEEAVIGRVLHGCEQGSIQAEPVRLVVELVLVALSLGDFHGDVENHGTSGGVWLAGAWVARRHRVSCGHILTHMTARRGFRAILGGFVIAVVLLAATGAGLTYAHDQGALNDFLCEGECPVEYAVTPERVREAKSEARAAETSSTTPIDAEELRRALAKPLSDPVLGDRVTMLAADARDGRMLVSHDVSAAVPASTTKVVTAWAVLTLLGPEHQFETTVRRSGDTIILVGGGDPHLVVKAKKGDPERANLRALARQVARAVGDDEVRLRWDDSLFTGPSVSPTWPATYVPAVTGPVSALRIDNDTPPSTRPAADAAEAFGKELRTLKVQVVGDIDRIDSTSEARGARIGGVGSAPLRVLVGDLLRTSDNAATEMMFRHAAIASAEPASFEGGQRAVTTALNRAQISTQGLTLADGSGLSRSNRIAPDTLVETLLDALENDRTAAIVTGMPIGGFNGTLEDRFENLPEAHGLVRAKTGTLTGVHSLAGWVTMTDGRPVVFAVIADRAKGSSPWGVQRVLDRIASVIATCQC